MDDEVTLAGSEKDASATAKSETSAAAHVSKSDDVHQFRCPAHANVVTAASEYDKSASPSLGELYAPRQDFDWDSYADVIRPYEIYHGPNAVSRHDGEHLPPPFNPFSPAEQEALAIVPLGYAPERPQYRTTDKGKIRVMPAYDELGRRVIIKVVKASSRETSICRYLQLQRRTKPDPRDHTIPFRDIITEGEWTFIVMPEWGVYDIYDVGEYMVWLRHILEGLTYLHEHGIAHRDVTHWNVMIGHLMDHGSLRGKPVTRRFPAPYGLIDFGCASHFDPSVPPERRLTIGSIAAPGYWAPELSDTVPYDPFKLDVRGAACCILNDMDCHRIVSPVPTLVQYLVPDFIQLLDDMTNDCPECRPSAAEALSHLRQIIAQTPEGILNSPGGEWGPSQPGIISYERCVERVLGRHQDA